LASISWPHTVLAFGARGDGDTACAVDSLDMLRNNFRVSGVKRLHQS
jgi:hypothetical protein